MFLRNKMHSWTIFFVSLKNRQLILRQNIAGMSIFLSEFFYAPAIITDQTRTVIADLNDE